MRATITRYPVLTFVLLALALQALDILVVSLLLPPRVHVDNDPTAHMVFRLRIFSPLIACLWVTHYLEGFAGIRKLLASYLHWRTPFKWYGVSLLWKFVLGWIGLGLTMLVTDAVWPGFFAQRFWDTYLTSLPFILVITFVEETSWIRFSISRLQERYTALQSALITGNAWGLWYVPMFLLGEGVPAGYPWITFHACIISLCILLVWVYNSSRSGTVLLLTQISSNSVFFMVPVLPGEITLADGGAETRYVMVYSFVFIAFAIGLVLVMGPTNLSRRPRMRWSKEKEMLAEDDATSPAVAGVLS